MSATEQLADILAYWYPDAGTGQALTRDEHLEAAEALLSGPIADLLAAEREQARAPFLAYADECAAIGDDRSASVVQRSINRAVAEAFRRAAARDQPC